MTHFSVSPKYPPPVHGPLKLAPGPSERYSPEENAARVFGDPLTNELKAKERGEIQ